LPYIDVKTKLRHALNSPFHEPVLPDFSGLTKKQLLAKQAEILVEIKTSEQTIEKLIEAQKTLAQSLGMDIDSIETEELIQAKNDREKSERALRSIIIYMKTAKDEMMGGP
jgi:hypothetical protein